MGKSKRQQVERLLHDLSDAELLELKRRLADVDAHGDADPIAGYVGDDGELVWRS